MITINADIAPFLKQFDLLAERLSPWGMQSVLADVGKEMYKNVAHRFETRTDPTGQAWQAWSPEYAKHYPKKGRGFILERSGDMINSLNWAQLTADSVSVGFGMPYAAFHEFGSDKSNLPARSSLFGDPENGIMGRSDEEAILKILEDWLNEPF